MRLGIAAALAAAVSFSSATRAQQAPASADEPVGVVQRLFDAMRASDSAAARRCFVPNGRVLPIPATQDGQSPSPGLTVDQFTQFVASNAPNSWNERIWEPHSGISGSLAAIWFEYDVVRADTVRQCGTNSVQVASTASGWKIVSMAFTTVRGPCSRPARS